MNMSKHMIGPLRRPPFPLSQLFLSQRQRWQGRFDLGQQRPQNCSFEHTNTALTFYHGWSPPDNTKQPDTGKCVMTFLWLSSMNVWLKKTERFSSFYHIFLFLNLGGGGERTYHTIQSEPHHFVVIMGSCLTTWHLRWLILHGWRAYMEVEWFVFLRALVSSSGLDSRQAMVDRVEQKSRANHVFYSSLTKGYLGSYKKGFMLGKRSSTATSILNWD